MNLSWLASYCYTLLLDAHGIYILEECGEKEMCLKTTMESQSSTMRNVCVHANLSTGFDDDMKAVFVSLIRVYALPTECR